jgi:hypothetical protein
MPLGLRGHLIEIALRRCGLETTAEGKVQPIEGEPPPKPRDKLAAMRIIATYDKLSIEEREIDLLEYPMGERPVPPVPDRHPLSFEALTKVLDFAIEKGPAPPGPSSEPEPQIDPEKQAEIAIETRVLDARWPISTAIRAALIEQAARLCGLSITGAGTIERSPVTEENPRQETRIVLAALRVFAKFDRLSIQHRRIEFLMKPPKHPRDELPEPHPEVLKLFRELKEEEARKWPEAGEEPIVAEPVPRTWWDRVREAWT